MSDNGEDFAPQSPDPEAVNSDTEEAAGESFNENSNTGDSQEPHDESRDSINDQDDDVNEEINESKDSNTNDAPESRSDSPDSLRQSSSQVVQEDQEEDAEEVADPDSDAEVSPTKRKRVALDSDDEDEDEPGPSTKKRTLVSSDEESGDEGDKDAKRTLLGSDLSDSDGEKEPKEEEEKGEVMRTIFGDESDDEGEGGEKPEQHEEERPAEDDDDAGSFDRPIDEEDDNREWDFDVMLRDKKAEKKKKRKRRDGGIDIINDDDGTIAHMVEAMKAATKEDRHSNMQRQPALKKRKMLQEVKIQLLRVDMMEAMIDNGMMSAVSDWLSPLPDKSLPALEIRTELLKLLQSYTRLEQGCLKQSGLGKAVMMLYKHPRETKENKERAAKLIREWSRPIFQLETDFRSVSKEERVQRDLENMPSAKRRRMSTEGGPSGSKGGPSAQDGLKPGDKGYIGRARVPRPSTKDYVVRPKSNIEGEFKGERKGTGFNRLDKTQRDFMERTKKFKAKRAITVSLEGRNMAI